MMRFWKCPAATRIACLENLAIELWAIRYNSSSSYEYVVHPDKDGRFTFDAVDPGMYVLLARGPGYIPVEYGAKGPALEGAPITLVSGQQLKDIKLTAAPGRLICGKVTHDGDRPWANQPIWVFGSPQPWDSPSPWKSPMSDADGRFRVTNLLPGQYFIGVNTEPSPDHVRIYWRSSWSFAEAQPINNVGAASEANCQDDIRVPRQEPPSHQIRGRLSGSARIKPQDRFYLQLSALNSAGSKGYSAVTQDIPINSDFGIPGVFPGTYLIEVYRGQWVNLSSPKVTSAAPLIVIPRPIATKRVTVGDRDISDVNVDVPLEASVSVTFQFDDVSTNTRRTPSDTSAWVTLSDAVNREGQTPNRNSQGPLEFQGLIPGDYFVDMHVYAPLYAKSILLDGRPVERQTFSLLPGQAAKLEIVMSDQGAEVDVTVKAEEPPPFDSDEECGLRKYPGTRVVLIPDPVRDNTSLLWDHGGNPDGTSRVEGVPPGKYRALAVDDYNSGWFVGYKLSISERRTRLIAVASLGVPIEVRAGEKLAVTLPTSTLAMQRLRAELGDPMSLQDHCAAGCSEQDFWFRSDLAPAESKARLNSSH